MQAVSTVRSSLNALVALLTDVVSPDEVAVEGDAGEPHSAPVFVRPLSVDRVGRSRREGPVLDLELKVAVICTGPRSIENVEQLIRAVEINSNYSVGPLDRSCGPADEAWLGLLMVVPVSLRLDEPQGPPVREPLEVRTVLVRH